MSALMIAVLAAGLVAPTQAKRVPNSKDTGNVVNSEEHRVDIHVTHFMGVTTSGQPNYMTIVIPEYPFADRAAALARAKEVTTSGMCWGVTTVTCYPAHEVRKVVVRPLTE